MNILCKNCGKDSGIEKSSSDGADAAKVQGINWVPKFLFMYGIDEIILTCSKECLKAVVDPLFEKHGVTQARKDQVADHLAECHKKVPQMAQETGEVMDRLQKALRPLAKK